MRRRLLPLVSALILVLALAAPASGHALVRKASPGPGETVSGTVDRVVLEFTEAVLPTPEIELHGPEGELVPALGPVNLREGDAVAELRFAPLEVPGSYRVDYSYASTDGHAERGAHEFRLEAASSRSAGGVAGRVVVGAAVVAVVAALLGLAFRAGRRERAH